MNHVEHGVLHQVDQLPDQHRQQRGQAPQRGRVRGRDPSLRGQEDLRPQGHPLRVQ